jgi:hypothetical protein
MFWGGFVALQLVDVIAHAVNAASLHPHTVNFACMICSCPDDVVCNRLPIPSPEPCTQARHMPRPLPSHRFKIKVPPVKALANVAESQWMM